MLFSVISLLREDIQDDAVRIAPDVNEFLGQWTQELRVAGVLLDKSGAKVGHFILMEAESHEAAEEYIGHDPYFRDKLYARIDLHELRVEAGSL